MGKWGRGKTEPTDKLTLLSGSIASGESRTGLGWLPSALQHSILLILNPTKQEPKRIDVSDRVLKWKLLFPNQIKIPFLMTKFSENPKPKNFIHPNKVRKIHRVSYGTQSQFIPMLTELCDDDTLQLFEGTGVKEVLYKK